MSNAMRFCVACCLAFLPAFQIYAAWAVTYPYILSVLLAFGAFVVLNENESIKNFLVSYILLAASFFIYQPTGMMFVFFVFLGVFFKEDNVFKLLVRNCSVLFFSLLTNFGFIKTYTHLYGSTGREELDFHLFEKVLWFFNRPFVQSVENYNIYPSIFYTLVSLCLILVGIWFTPRKWNFFVKIAMVGAFCFIIYAPNTFLAQAFSPYRTLAGMESILGVLFLNGIFHIVSKFLSDYKYVSCFLMVSVALTAIFNINRYIIDVQQEQLADMAAAFKSIPRGKTIDFDIRGVDDRYYSDFMRYEYGALSINNSWTPKAMAMDIIKNNGLNDVKMTDGILVSDPVDGDIYYMKMSEIKNMKY